MNGVGRVDAQHNSNDQTLAWRRPEVNCTYEASNSSDSNQTLAWQRPEVNCTYEALNSSDPKVNSCVYGDIVSTESRIAPDQPKATAEDSAALP